MDNVQLKRDYKNNPLKRGEFPEVEDIQYLFLELNLSREECAEICCCTIEKIKHILKQNNIRKSSEQKSTLRKRTTLKKYGVENISQLKSIKEKKEQTCLFNYGVKNPAQADEVQNKIKETCLERYGRESSNSTLEKKNRIKQTVQKKYDVSNVMQAKQIKQKHAETLQAHYNVDNPTKSLEIREKQKRTCLKKYGHEHMFGSEYFKQKAKESFLAKYGEDNPMKSPKVLEKVKQNIEVVRQKILEKMPQTLEKIYATKRKNNSFNTSSIEDKLYKELCLKFPEVIRQYKSKEYPYLCDFYIPLKDLYIEYHGNWTHGKEPFCSENSEHLIYLEYMLERAKTSEYYRQAVYTWTKLDVRKRAIAEKNNLNYLTFYNEKQFYDWYTTV